MILEKYLSYDTHPLRSRSAEYFQQLWLEHPSYFNSRYGLTLLLRGTNFKKTNQQGIFNINYFYHQPLRTTVYVGEKHAHTKVFIRYQGPYLLVQSEKGQILTALKFLPIGIITPQPQNVLNLEEMIMIKPFQKKKKYHLDCNGIRYRFSADQVDRCASLLPAENQTAFYLHLGSSQGEQFQIIGKKDSQVVYYDLKLVGKSSFKKSFNG